MRELGLTFSSAFEDAIVKGEKLSKVMKGLLQGIARVLARKIITEPLSMAVEFSPKVPDENSPVCFGAASGYEGTTIVLAAAFGGRPWRLGIAPGWGLRGVTGGNKSACWRMR